MVNITEQFNPYYCITRKPRQGKVVEKNIPNRAELSRIKRDSNFKTIHLLIEQANSSKDSAQIFDALKNAFRLATYYSDPEMQNLKIEIINLSGSLGVSLNRKEDLILKKIAESKILITQITACERREDAGVIVKKAKKLLRSHVDSRITALREELHALISKKNNTDFEEITPSAKRKGGSKAEITKMESNILLIEALLLRLKSTNDSIELKKTYTKIQKKLWPINDQRIIDFKKNSNDIYNAKLAEILNQN
jgi:hypothetical protein